MKQIDLYTKNGEVTGETIEPGGQLPADRYPLLTDVWVRDPRGCFLVIKEPDSADVKGQMPGRNALTGIVTGYTTLTDFAARNESSFLCALRLIREKAGILIAADQGRMLLRRAEENAAGMYPRVLREVWLFEYDGQAMKESGMQTIQEGTGETGCELRFVSASGTVSMLACGEPDHKWGYFQEMIAQAPRVAPVRKGYRTVSFSRTEVSRAVRYPDINGQGRLFGGRLLEWIDEIAGIAAMRHAGGNVTTVSIEHLEFKKGAFANDTLVLIANVTHVGGSSIEVRVDTWFEDLKTGKRTIINRAFLTEVFIDENSRPAKVPYGLVMESEAEMAKWEGAQRRINVRKQSKKEGF